VQIHHGENQIPHTRTMKVVKREQINTPGVANRDEDWKFQIFGGSKAKPGRAKANRQRQLGGKGKLKSEQRYHEGKKTSLAGL
jgi:hypothetical protein